MKGLANYIFPVAGLVTVEKPASTRLSQHQLEMQIKIRKHADCIGMSRIRVQVTAIYLILKPVPPLPNKRRTCMDLGW